MEQQRNWTGWILITAIVIISGAALAASTLAGSEPQAAAPDPELQKHEAIIRTLFPDAGDPAKNLERVDTDGNGFIYAVQKDGGVLGYAVQQTVQGYGGPIDVTAALLPDYTLGGIHVGGENFRETDGLGAKAKEPAFTDQFKGSHLPVKLGQGIDGIAGATVTSQAVVDGVNAAAERLYSMPGMTMPSPSASPISNDRTANASVIGYGGPVLVRLTLDEAGAVENLQIGDVRFQETEGVGSRIREEGFAQSFIGKKPPLKLEDIDAVSGATVSSQAAVDAANTAYAFLTEKETPSDTN